MGYMFGFLPTLVKLSTINNLIKASAGSLFKRAEIDKNKLKKIMSIALFILIAYLSIWTIVDTPLARNDYRFTKEDKVVVVFTGCSSDANWWEFLSFSFEAMILIATTALTYFCRGVIEE